MDIQYLITINLMVVSALAIVSVLTQMPWRESVLWLAVNAAVIATGAAALQWWPEQAGTLAALVFLPFVMAPIIFTNLARKSAQQNAPKRAAWLAWIAATLHPTRRARFNAAVMAAHAHATPQDQIAALEALAPGAREAERFQLEALKLRLANDWRGVLTHLRRSPFGSPQLDSMEIRALGELGYVDEMARVWQTARDRMIGTDITDAFLFVLAFGGRPGAVATLLQQGQSNLDDDSKDFWLAISQRAAGAPEPLWRPTLERLAATAKTPATRARASLQLQQPSEPASAHLTAAGLAIIDQAADRLDRQATMQRRDWLATPVTYLMLIAYGVVYAIEERSGGSQNLRNLVDLGALWPPLVIDRGEWWRLATATFLHFGILHAGANGLMLYFLGRPCELSFGSLRMLVLYIAGGVASSAFVLALYAWGGAEPSVLVGASGAVMAVFGGLVGHRLLMWLRHRDVLDRRFLTMVPVILGLQVAADLSMPQVSLSAHASGFCAGLVIGILLALTIPQPGPVNEPQAA